VDPKKVVGYREPLPEIAQINFNKADWNQLREKLQQANLKEKVKSAASVEDGIAKIIECVIQAADELQIPRKHPQGKMLIPKYRQRLFRR
jgi:hypothetical protein